MNRILLLVLLFFIGRAQAQEPTKKERGRAMKMVDSMFIDHNPENYSFRLFTNYKVKQFKIVNDDYTFSYVPNNRFGAGFGVANSKILIDIAFNIKTHKDEGSKRFDAQGTYIYKKRHYLNGYLQLYNGFNIHNDLDTPREFRSDVKSKTMGLNHLYTFSDIEFSYALLKAGLPTTNRNFYFTGGIGSFFIFDYFSANGSIWPEGVMIEHDESQEIERYGGGAVGILGGILTAFQFQEKFIATCNVMPGVAIMNKKVQLQEEDYRASNPMLYKVDLNLALSYNVKRYYVNFTYETGIYATNLDLGNKYRFNLSMAKLAVGYKFNK